MARVAVQDIRASLRLPGTQSVNLGGGPGTAINASQAYTVMQWVKRSKIVDSQGHSMMGNVVGDKFWFNFNASGDQKLRSYHSDLSPSSVASSIAITDYDWHHVAATFGSGVTKLYIDGVQVASQARTGTLSLNTTNFYVGSDNGFNFNGWASNAGVYSRALTAAEILTHYQSGGSYVPAGNIYGFYKLNEGAGLVALDVSGNGNNGTIAAGTVYSADTPTRKRALVGGNLIQNGDFEYAPPFVAAQTSNTGGRWIDGTSGGSTSNDLFGYGVSASGTYAIQFDSTQTHGGSNALKISLTAAGSNVTVGPATKGGLNTANTLKYAMAVLPYRSYIASVWVKASSLAGSAATGAIFRVFERSGDGSTTTASNTSTTITANTSGWVQLSIVFTTVAGTRYVALEINVVGNDGAATLTGDFWFDDLSLTETTPVGRVAVQDFKSSLNFGTATNTVSTATTLGNSTVATLSAWVKRSGLLASGVSRIIAFGSDTFQITIGSTAGSGGVPAGMLGVNNAAHASTGRFLEAGIWYHVCAVKNGTNCKVYLNGSEIYSATVTSGASGAITLGAYTGEGLVGLLTKANAWQTNLSASQVRDLYTAGVVPAASLVGSWLLNDGAGPTALDSSGNANNGTITGATYSSDVPMKKRLLVGDNLVTNGDFEYAPPFTAAQTGNNWLDGSAAGASNNLLFGWRKYSSSVNNTARFDPTDKYSGSQSLLLFNNGGLSSYNWLGTDRNVAAAEPTVTTLQENGIKVQPSTSYVLVFRAKADAVLAGGQFGIELNILKADATSLTKPSALYTVTTSWQQFSISFTTGASAYWFALILKNGQVGVTAVQSNVRLDDITLTPTSNTVRALA